MAIPMLQLQRRKAVLPPRVLIYGPPGLGKTSLASEFVNSAFLQVEDGTPSDIEVVSFGHLTTFAQVMEALVWLYSEEHDRKTVVIDSVDKLEPLVWAKVCADNNWRTIEDPGYGKGYVLADSAWREVMEGLTALRVDRGMTIVLIAHSTIVQFDSPTTASYSKFDIRLHKRALAMVQDEVDAILLVKQDETVKVEDKGFNRKHTHAEGGGTRWIYCEGRPAFTAKNRYGMPDRIMYPKGKGYAAMAKYFPAQSAPEAPKWVDDTNPQAAMAEVMDDAA